MAINRSVASDFFANDNTRWQLLLALGLILFVVGMRIVPHPANFAPVAAVAIFGGAILPRRWALTLPLAAMIVSDLIIGLHPLVWLTWSSFMLLAFLSNRWLRKPGITSVIGASFSGAVLFFVITNFGVWLEGLLYPHTWAGLMNAYIQALPFFRNTLLSTLLYSGVLFGAYAAATQLAQRRQTAPMVRH